MLKQQKKIDLNNRRPYKIDSNCSNIPKMILRIYNCKTNRILFLLKSYNFIINLYL